MYEMLKSLNKSFDLEVFLMELGCNPFAVLALPCGGGGRTLYLQCFCFVFKFYFLSQKDTTSILFNPQKQSLLGEMSRSDREGIGGVLC